jgi:shikimate dehydrogenase
MQNGVFEALNLDYAYLAFDVKVDKVTDAVKAIRALKFRGANITMPLKRVICEHLDRLSPAAEMAGAVNTIVNDDGILTGHITDGVGYMMSLDDEGVEYTGKKLTVVGMGGASTAVMIQAAMQGVKSIDVFNVLDEFFASGQSRAEMIQSRLGCNVNLFDLADKSQLKNSMLSSDIFINGTPVGMESTLDQSVVPDISYFHPDLIVSDLIYVPQETSMLKAARSIGCKTISGLGMQMYQGVVSFRLWTGLDMPVELARKILFG